MDGFVLDQAVLSEGEKKEIFLGGRKHARVLLCQQYIEPL